MPPSAASGSTENPGRSVSVVTAPSSAVQRAPAHSASQRAYDEPPAVYAERQMISPKRRIADESCRGRKRAAGDLRITPIELHGAATCRNYWTTSAIRSEIRFAAALTGSAAR